MQGSECPPSGFCGVEDCGTWSEGETDKGEACNGATGPPAPNGPTDSLPFLDPVQAGDLIEQQELVGSLPTGFVDVWNTILSTGAAPRPTLGNGASICRTIWNCSINAFWTVTRKFSSIAQPWPPLSSVLPIPRPSMCFRYMLLKFQALVCFHHCSLLLFHCHNLVWLGVCLKFVSVDQLRKSFNNN